MAKNPPRGLGRRGAVKNRIQYYNPHNKRWMKVDDDTHLIIDQKANKKPFKGVRKG